MSRKQDIFAGGAWLFRNAGRASDSKAVSEKKRNLVLRFGAIQARSRGKTVFLQRISGLILCMVLMVSLFPVLNTPAASTRLYYPETGKSEVYKGTLVTYKYNDSVLSLNGIKGIITDNGVALGPYLELFEEQLGVKCTENSSENKITFQHGSNTLVLTLGSKTAVLNGKKVTTSAAPVKIKFTDLNLTRIMVPTRFVAESLGYDYKWDSAAATVTIRNRMTLSYNNKISSYIGTTGKVLVDGVQVDVSDFPTILLNNTAMLRVDRVFGQAMGVSCSYEPDTGVIVLRKGALTLRMQENSTAAYLNGVRADCGVAPLNVTYQENGITALLVPGRFVSESLGYDYTWNSSTKTSEICTTAKVGVADAPEQENEEDVEDEEDVVKKIEEYSFIIDEDKYLEYENIINNTSTSVRTDAVMYYTSFIDNIYRDMSNKLSESYVIQFGSPVNEADSFMEEGRLIVTLKNTVCEDKVWGNTKGNLVTAIEQSFDSSSFSAALKFDLSAAFPYYSLSMSDDGMSLTVHIYPNYLLGLETGTNLNGSYLRFRGIHPFTYETAQEDGYYAVYFKNTCNTLGNIVFPDEIFSDFFDYALMLEPESDTVKLLYKPADGISLTIVEESNDFYLYFNYDKKEEDDNGTWEKPEEPEEPVDIDGISVRLPSGVSFSDLSVEDQYWNQKIVFTLPGELEQFYQNNRILSPYSVVNDIAVSQNNGKTKIVLSTSRIQGYNVQKSTDGFTVKLGNPSEIYSKIIVLDAGHGGIDPGARAGGYNEKDINFTILNKYAKEYFDDSDIKVYFSRTTDTKIDLYERANFASRVEADLFISLHMNAADSSSANGTSVYYSTLNTSVAGGLTSQMMASEFTARLSAALGTKNRGVMTQNFVVVKETRMPAVLIELAFITNSSDRKIITNPTMQKKTAKTIFETVTELFKKYPTGR